MKTKRQSPTDKMTNIVFYFMDNFNKYRIHSVEITKKEYQVCFERNRWWFGTEGHRFRFSIKGDLISYNHYLY
jgi:hypothetical protein